MRCKVPVQGSRAMVQTVSESYATGCLSRVHVYVTCTFAGPAGILCETTSSRPGAERFRASAGKGDKGPFKHPALARAGPSDARKKSLAGKKGPAGKKADKKGPAGKKADKKGPAGKKADKKGPAGKKEAVKPDEQKKKRRAKQGTVALRCATCATEFIHHVRSRAAFRGWVLL